MMKFLQSSKKGWNDLSSSPRIIWEQWSWSKRGLWSKKSSLWKSDLNQRLVVFSHFASYSRSWMIYGSVRLWKLPIMWWRFIETFYWIISKYSQCCIMLVVQWPGLADDPIKPISEHNDGTEDLFISRDHVGGTSKLCKVWYTWRALQINLWSAQFQSSDWTPVTSLWMSTIKVETCSVRQVIMNGSFFMNEHIDQNKISNQFRTRLFF